MKRLLSVLLLAAAPLLAQTPTPTVTPTPTITRTPTWAPTPYPAPSKYRLRDQVQPGFSVNLLGDTYYALNATTFQRLAGNITTTRNFKCQTGTGSVSAAPAWCTLVSGDIPNNAANTTGSAAKWTNARLLAGNSVDGSAAVTFANKFIVQGTTDAGLSAAQFLGALGTGILKNTVTTGVLSIAAASDLPSLLTTKGDLGCFSTIPTTLGIGTNTYVLTADSTKTCGFDWKVATGGGSGTVDGISTVTLVAGSNVTISDNTPGAGQITIASSGGSGFATTVKGDLHGFSTVEARVPVGTDGQVPKADSTATTGLSYQWPRIGTLRTLKETVFAGITPASYANGSTTTIDGSGYTCSLAGNGTADIVATGLRIRKGTTGTTEDMMAINPGNTGDIPSIIGEARWRRGQYAIWSHLASYDYTNASNNIYGSFEFGTAYPKWGVVLRRNKNQQGAPNTATGGLGFTWWWNGDANVASYPGVTTADVWMAFFRTPWDVDLYYGTWSSGWPTMEAMTLWATLQMRNSTTTLIAGQNTMTPFLASTHMLFQLGGAVATTGTFEIIFDRWRVTAWE